MRYPIHTILYSKWWYNHRGDVDKMWLDYVHTINADGWTVLSKNDVATWCLHRFDDFKKSIWKDNDRYNLANFFVDMSKSDDIYYHRYQKNLDNLDKIIVTFNGYLSELSSDDIDEWFAPSEKVLPFHYMSGGVETHYNEKGFPYKKWSPSEMHEDVLKRIEKIFGDTPSDIRWANNFEDVEGSIHGKTIEDVLVSNGSDANCEEIILIGRDLNRRHTDDGIDIDLGSYNNISFENTKSYRCRIKTEVVRYNIEGWNDFYTFHVKSIKER